MKKWLSLSIITLLLIIVGLGILLPNGMIVKIQGKIIQEKYPNEQEANYSLIEENSINPPLSDYVSITYKCEDFNYQIRCTGEVKYSGPREYKTPEMYVRLYCYDERRYEGIQGFEECTLDNDYLYLGSMDFTNNNIPYQLKCYYGENKNFKAEIGLSDGVMVYPYRC